MKTAFLSIILSSLTFLTALAQDAPTRVVLVGDSTVASRTGWGDAFASLLRTDVECVNFGRGGRSSKSYRAEGHWQKVLDLHPSWILIQFGHNDQAGKGPERETDPQTSFRENLTRYITEARAAGAQPVLVTSLTRRNFNKEGKIIAASLEPATDGKGEKSADMLTAFAAATRAVAAATDTPLIDLNARSIQQLNTIGPAAALAYDPPAKDPAHPDKTHLNGFGAAETAKLVAEEIQTKIPKLAPLLEH